MPRTASAVVALAFVPVVAHAQCQLQKFQPQSVYSDFGIHTRLTPQYGAVVSNYESIAGSAVTMYRRSGNTLTPAGVLAPQDGNSPSTASGSYGLAIAGNMVVMGGILDGDPAQGRVFTFVDNGTEFVQEGMLLPPTANVDAFGSAIATDGQRLVVTSSWTAPNGGPGGNAWVYTRTQSGWSLIQSNLNTSTMDGPEFGMSVSMQGDTLAIGAPDQYDPGFYGSVFVYSWNGNSYTQEAQLLPPDEIYPPQGFGLAVAVHGDLLFAGAPDRPFSGQVYTYKRTNGVWSYVETLNPGTFFGSEFGRRIAYLPESSTLLVGAEGEMHGDEASSGAVYRYQISASGHATPLGPMIPSDLNEGHRFGAGVAASDGLAFIGARGDQRGSAYVFIPVGDCPPACAGNACGSSDYNGDGDFGTDADIEAFFACLAGNCCTSCFCQGSDFNGDGDFGTDSDIEAFFRVLAGGNC